MTDKLTIAIDAHLANMLETRERELEEARYEIDTLKRSTSSVPRWMYQCRSAGDVDELPSPRVQLSLLDNKAEGQKWQVALLYRDGKNFLVRVPLAYSETQTGSKLDIEGLWENETPGKPASTELLSRLPTLLNALCETHNTLGFPAYIVLDDRQIRVKQVFPIFEGEIVR
jgi:hypothetical protein